MRELEESRKVVEVHKERWPGPLVSERNQEGGQMNKAKRNKRRILRGEIGFKRRSRAGGKELLRSLSAVKK